MKILCVEWKKIMGINVRLRTAEVFKKLAQSLVIVTVTFFLLLRRISFIHTSLYSQRNRKGLRLTSFNKIRIVRVYARLCLRCSSRSEFNYFEITICLNFNQLFFSLQPFTWPLSKKNSIEKRRQWLIRKTKKVSFPYFIDFFINYLVF